MADASRPTVSGPPEQVPEVPAEPLEAPTSTGARRWGGLGLIGKAAVALLAVGLVPLALVGAVALQRQQEQIRSEAELLMKSNAERIASQVDEWVDKNLRVLQAAARLSTMTSMQAEQQTEVLVAIQQSYPWMYLVHTMGPDAMNVARNDGKPLTSYADRGYFKDVMQLGKPLSWETVIGKTSKKPALVMSVAIKVNDRVVGVLGAAMNIEDISRVVATWSAGRTGHAFLVDQTGKVVAHPRQEFVLSEASLADHPLVASLQRTGLPRLVSFADKDGQATMGYVQGTKLNWAVGVQQQEDELFAPLRRALLIGLAVLGGVALLVAVAVRFASVILVRPIVELTEAADQMSLGELEAPIVLARRDELGGLARSLERLRKSMRAAIQRLEAGPPPPGG
jgi:methyl-accepting chemotaxis protein